MYITQRVRAILLTDSQHLLLVKRMEQGFAPFWVAPGGGVEPGDASREHALLRELRREFNLKPHIIKPVMMTEHILEEEVVVQQWFYLCRIEDSVLLNNTSAAHLEMLSLNAAALKPLNIQPLKLKQFLMANPIELLRKPSIRVS
jgi:ADP-ribose pyrophosphatase YjhB (NUDIX family)